jgi:hypothetical protein
MLEPMREIQSLGGVFLLCEGWSPALEYERAETYARANCVWPEDFEPVHFDFLYHSDGRVILGALESREAKPMRCFVCDVPAEVLA